MIDVIGIILDVGYTFKLDLKGGTMKDKRTMTIGDEDNISIAVTLWGDVCEANQYREGDIIALRYCSVSEYQGKSLNASPDLSDISFNIKHPRCLDLQRF